MADPVEPSRPGPPSNQAEPGQSRLRQILTEHPEARGRVWRAVAGLMATTLVAVAALGLFLIWHIMRRAQLVRERLGPPRKVDLPDLSRPTTEPSAQARDGAAPSQP